MNPKGKNIARYLRAMELSKKIMMEFDDLIALSTTIAEGTAHLAVLRTEVAIVDRVRYQQAAGEAKAQEVKPDAGA